MTEILHLNVFQISFCYLMNEYVMLRSCSNDLPSFESRKYKLRHGDKHIL